jgi:hypothetical protein
MSGEKEVFETSDFYLAVYFKSKGSKLKEARQVPKSNKVIFSFEYNGQDLETKKFYNKECTIEPVGFISAIRELKGISRTI